MTDDLVKRLDAEINATYGKHPCGLLSEVKNRIERLETEVRMTATYDRLMQKLADDQAQRIEQLEAALRLAAGMVSTTLPFDIDHPEEVLEWIMKESAALGEKKDG